MSSWSGWGIEAIRERVKPNRPTNLIAQTGSVSDHVHILFALARMATQAKHHRKVTFQDEYRQFLEKHRVEFDERYVWG